MQFSIKTLHQKYQKKNQKKTKKKHNRQLTFTTSSPVRYQSQPSTEG